MPRNTINVIIADDHNVVRSGIKQVLDSTSGIKVIAEASTGEEAVRLTRQLIPNIVIMDLRMPGIGGIEATRKILRFCPDVKVLVLTACNDNIHPARLLQIGVAGYLTKETTMEEMINAIRSVHAGQRYVSSTIAQQLVLNNIDNENKSPFNELSSRELQVALMITQSYKVQEIANKLNLSPKTINSYRYRIFEKLGIKGDVELTHLAIQYKLMENYDQE